ncbi:MAG: hypothetical protein AAFQ82_04940, partial [Myxococcota bacterium]
LPKVAIAWDDGISQLSAGALRFVVERRLGLPVVPIRTNRFGRADLSDYDVVIVPSGSPRGALGSSGLGKPAQRLFDYRDRRRKGGRL